MALDLFTLLGTVRVDTGGAERKLTALDGAAHKSKESLDRAGDAAEKAGTKINHAGGQARDAAGRFVAAGEKAEQSTRRQATAVGALSSSLDELAGRMTRVGVGLTASITAPLLGAAVAATKFAGDLESAVANVQTIRPDFDGSRLFNGLSRMQTRVNQTSAQLGEASYQIVSSIDDIGDAATLNLTEKFGRGAAAARTEAGVFGKAIIGAMTQFETGVEGADHVMDVFFNTVNRGIVDGAELANEFAAVGKSAKTAGVDLDTLGGLIVGVTKEAGPAAQNINDLANFLNKFKTEPAVKGFRALGVEVQKHGQYRPMLDILTDFKSKFDELDEVTKAGLLQKMLPDAQAQRGLVTLLAQLDAVRKSATENRTTSGSADKAFDVVSKTFNFQAALFTNTVRHVFEQIGAVILPLLTPVVSFLGGKLVAAIAAGRAAWDTLSPGLKAVAVTLLGLAAAAGPVLVAVGTVAGAIISLGGSIATVVTAVTAAGGLGAIAAALSPVIVVGLKVAAVAALVGAALLAVATGAAAAWATNFMHVRDVTFAVWDAIKGHVTATLAVLRDAWSSIYPTLVSVTRKALGAGEALWESFGKTAVASALFVFNYVAPKMRELLRVVLEVVDAVAKAVDGDWAPAMDKMKTAAARAVAAVSDVMLQLPVKVAAAFAMVLGEAAIFAARFMVEAQNAGGKFVVGLITTIVSLKDQVTNAIGDALVMAAAGVNAEAIGAAVGRRFTAGMAQETAGAQRRMSVPGVSANGQDLANEDARLRAKNAAALNPAASAAGGLRNLNLGGGGGRGGGSGSGESKALRAARLEMEALEIVASKAKRLYELRAGDANYFYDNGLSSLSSFVSESLKLENERFAAELDVAKKELAVASATNATGKAKENLVAKAQEKIEALTSGHGQALVGIERKSVSERMRIWESTWAGETDRLQELASGQAEAFDSLAQRGVTSFARAQELISGAQYELLLRAQEKLFKDLGAVSADSPQAAALEGQLGTLLQTIANFNSKRLRDADEARRQDLQREFDRASQLRSVYDSIADYQMGAADAHVRVMEQSASSTSELLSAERLRLDFDLRAADLRAARDRAALDRQRAYVEAFEQNERQRVAMVEAINAQIVASDATAAVRRGLLIEDFLNTQRERLGSISDTLAGGLSDQIENGFRDGWRGALSGFRQLLDDMHREALRAQVFRMLRAVFNFETAEESKDGKAGTGPTNPVLKGLAQALGIGGLDAKAATTVKAVDLNTRATDANTDSIGELTRRLSGGPGAAGQSAAGESFGFGGLAQIVGALLFPHASGDAAKTNTAGAVRDAGEQAVNAVKGAGQAQAGAIETTGGATSRGLGNISQTLLTGLAGIANQIAIGQTGGGFWKGFFMAAASGAINGAMGALFAPSSGGGGGVGAGALFAGAGGMAVGGPVNGPGSSTSDSVMAWLSNGEYVLKAAAVRGIGLNALDYMNAAGKLPPVVRRAEGGLASPSYAPTRVQPRDSARPGSGHARGGDVHVEVKLRPDAQGRVRSRSQVEVEVYHSSSDSARRNS